MAGCEFEAEVVGEAPHGVAGVDFTDAVPVVAVWGVVEEGVDTDGSDV